MNSSEEISLEQCEKLIRNIPDFPKPGIAFKDITPLLADRPCFQAAVNHIGKLCERERLQPEILACPEARGFIFGAALAYRLGVGFVPIRKPNKLPHHTHRVDYDLEYGTDAVEMHMDAIKPGEKVILVDDLLATGGTMAACAKLIENNQAKVLACVFLIELQALKGREQLLPIPSYSLLSVP